MNNHAISCDDPIFRRIPVTLQLYRPETEELHTHIFLPSPRDIDGLSVSRGKTSDHPEFLSLEQFAEDGRNPKGYFVAELSLISLDSRNILVVPDPTDNDPGHCLIPSLRYQKPRPSEMLELMELLKQLTICVHGPFRPEDKNDAGH
jgi:hypothetical protein